MSSQLLLNNDEIETLARLLSRSQQLRTREALCVNIGIDYKELSFIRNSSERDFCLLLINHLNNIGEKKALCKLCRQELLPVFSQAQDAIILIEITTKLNCNQKGDNNLNSLKTQDSNEVSIINSIFGRSINILVVVTGIVAFLYYFTSQSQPLPLGTYQATCKNISVKNNILTATCGDIHGQQRTSSLEYKQCKYGIENMNGILKCRD